jgi:tetratricopeptide (TPR) repeat protein
MRHNPANSKRLQRCFGALLLVVVCSSTAFGAQPPIDPAFQHDQCVAEAETDPQASLARARQWSNNGGGFNADHCAATALFYLKHYAEAARLFEKLARGMAPEGLVEQARVYDQAGQAWLVANQPSSAKADFDAALQLTPVDPDLFIDRAEALAAAKDYWAAIDDLNRASELAPRRPEIYVYRATAYRAVDALPLARQDIELNLKLAPNNVVGLLERGNIRRMQGDFAGARRDWISVTKIAPGSSSAAAAEENLARLGKIREESSPPKASGPS